MANEITPAELAKKEGVSVDAIRARWNAQFRETPFDRNRAISHEQMAKISREITRNEPAKSSPRSANKKRVNTIPPAPGANVLPAAEPQKRRTFREALDGVRALALDALLIGAVELHALLIWFDCWSLWQVPGAIAGALSFVIVTSAVLLATDETKNVTSQWALTLVAIIDFAAWWVHDLVFGDYGVAQEITAVLCGFLCLLSFGALFLFRHKNNN